MPVYAGKDGKITFASTKEIAGMGSWSISGITRDMLDKTAFGDQWKGVKQGVADGGTVSFSGNFDWSSTQQQDLITYHENGTALTTGSSFRLWVSDRTGDTGHGYWKLKSGTGQTAEMLIQSMNVKQDKSGLGNIDFTMKISGGYMTYAT